MLAEGTIKRLTAARYLYELAVSNERADSEVASFACINILHDALEIFLIAGADFVNANVSKNTDFIQYIDRITEKIGTELLFRRRLMEINKVRVLSKHDGVPPNRTELKGYLEDARQFLESASVAIFDKEFWTISLLELLPDSEEKGYLATASEAYENGQFETCLFSCRKAFFNAFEQPYCVQTFATGKQNVFSHVFCHAPNHARSKQYIETSVKSPFDYVVLDHNRIDAELTKDGLPHGVFWNIWRLAPQVYRYKDGPWYEKNDLKKLDAEGLKSRASYVLDATIGLFVQREQHRRTLRWIAYSANYVVREMKAGGKVFERADQTSPVLFEATKEVPEVRVEYSTRGLNDDRTYWHVLHEFNGVAITGFVFAEDLE